MTNLRQAAEYVADELTKDAISPSQGKKLYAPYLVQLGMMLWDGLEAKADSDMSNPGLRRDVLLFAREMAAVMDEKDKEKGVATQRASQALQEVQFQLGKFQQHPFPSSTEIHRILIHIANFAMIALEAIERDGGFM
jgi:hypothetical protein